MQVRRLGTLMAMLAMVAATNAGADAPLVQRLNWGGIKLVGNDTTVFVDAIGPELLQGESAMDPVPIVTDTSRRYALLTHAHNDHFDAQTLERVLGERGYVIAHESIATYIASRGFRVLPAATYQPVQRGGFVFTAVPAEDGFGDEQVSWVIAFADKRYLHAGDTLWHGQWQTIGTQYGPFDAAFLPINAAVVQTEPPIETPATMTPAQAVDAALLLRARRLVPIHYGGDDPPHYREIEQPLATLLGIARSRDMPVVPLGQGDMLGTEGPDSTGHSRLHPGKSFEPASGCENPREQ